jgi:hypothetical protein
MGMLCATLAWPLGARGQISPIWTWQSNQPTAMMEQFLGKLYQVQGNTLLLGDLMFREDEWRAPHWPLLTDQRTVFSIDYDRVNLDAMQAGLPIRCKAWLPMSGPPRLFINEDSPTTLGKILKLEGNKVICPVTIYWIDHMAKTFLLDDHTRVYYEPDVYVPELPVLKQGKPSDIKAGLVVEAVVDPVSDVAKKVFIHPQYKSDEPSMSHARSVAALPARQFNSKLALQVHLDPEQGLFSEMGPLVGTTPSEKPLTIPAGKMWCVAPGPGVTNDQLVAEINAQQIPGLVLTNVAAGADLSFLEKLPNLRSLRLTGAGVTDAQCVHLKPLGKIEELYLGSDQNLTDAGLSQLPEMDDLMKLDVSGTRVNGTGLKDKYLIPLERMNFNGTQLTDEGFRSIEGCSNIAGLYCAHTNVTDAGMEALETLGTLRELDLSGTAVGDEGLKDFENLSDLTFFNLADTKVSSVGMEYLQEMTSLRSLNLSHTRVDDQGLQYIKLMTQLEKLDLSTTHVTAAGAAAMKQAIPGCLVEYP